MRRVWRLTSARTRTRRSRTISIMLSNSSRRAMCSHVKRVHWDNDLARGKVRLWCGNRLCSIIKKLCIPFPLAFPVWARGRRPGAPKSIISMHRNVIVDDHVEDLSNENASSTLRPRLRRVK